MFSEHEERQGEETRPKGKGKAEVLLGAVLQQALSLLSGKKSRAAEELDRISRAIRQTADSFGGEDPIGISRYAEQAADEIGKASAYFRERDVMDLLRDAQQLAQRRPGLAIGGAFAMGFVLARFLKTSSGNSRGEGVSPAR
jgi:cell division septum initiation protein DivIVA